MPAGNKTGVQSNSSDSAFTDDTILTSSQSDIMSTVTNKSNSQEIEDRSKNDSTDNKYEASEYEEKHTGAGVGEESGWLEISSPLSGDESTKSRSHHIGADVSAVDISSNELSNVIVKDEPFEWTPYAELHLLNSLRGLRPVGANYDFCITVIHERFNQAMEFDVPRSELVKKINSYYNLEQALKIGGEDIRLRQYAFSLPKEEFGQEMMKRRLERSGIGGESHKK